MSDLQKIIKLKKELDYCGIDYSNLVYMPVIPMIGIDKSYVIEEVAGIKVARLISSDEQ